MIFSDFRFFDSGGSDGGSGCCVGRDPRGEAPWATRVLRDRFPFVWKSKIDIFEQILRKSEVTTNVQAPNTVNRVKSTKISKYEIFDFPKLAPERS